MAELLHPLTLPLQGSRLIEASAGTGKTWTIAALYLRLVLGHAGTGPGQPAARPLAPAEILVMTFTKAATRELSDRIRRRLVEAAACFRGEAAPAAGDHFLAGLLADHPDGAAREAAAWRLALCAEAMDDAAVFTIDAWCQRMLREHAFDSGCLFDEELLAQEATLLAEAARDYWRQQVYPLDADALAVALATWKDVDALLAGVRALQALPVPAAAGQGTLAACIAGAGAQRAQAVAALKQGWVAQADTMLQWLDAQTHGKDGPFNKVKLKPSNYSGWIATLRAWAADPQADTLVLTPAARDRLTPAGLHAALKPGAEIAPPPCFAAFEALLPALDQLPAPGPALRAHAAVCVGQRLQQLKAQAGRFGFADMLDRLDQALDAGARGDKALQLRARILAQYPVALVDEFQDTSPVQLRIFDRLYRIAANDPQHTLLLIGDPKQSIYGFRGADIHSYLQARRATAGRHHMLGTNHRSTVALVQAVNGVFARAEARPGPGAFLFDDAADPAGRAVPFVAVQARGRNAQFVAGGAAQPPLLLCTDTTLRSKAASRTLFAALCAERIVALLNDAGAGFASTDGDGNGTRQRLRPADIAVLVRTGTEAQAVRAALRVRGVASVYLSDKDSVFASAEAQDLLRLLQAVAAPRDVRLARAALATALVGLPLETLVALADDDSTFDARCALFAELHAVWLDQGLLAMVRRALHGLDLPARWLAGEGGAAGEGERRLTNVLHLAELLQAAAGQLDGEQALIRWLAQQIDDTLGGQGVGGDDQVLRLESDADLVQVVTVHKSKGLEYPLVFLPFAAHFRAVASGGTQALWLPAADGQRTLVLAPDAAQLAAADADRLREDLRLLYVALTRARHHLWVGAAALKRGRATACLWRHSALGALVSGSADGTAATPQAMAADLAALAHAVPGLLLEPVAPEAADPPRTRLLPRGTPRPLAPAPAYAAAFDRQWSISSYSALVKDAHRQPGADAPPRLLRDDEPGAGPLPAPSAAAAWHRFPRGAFAGNFLHDQLEWLAGEGFALDGSEALQQALLRRCERQGWGHRSADVLAWLRQVCSVPVPVLGTALSGLDTARPEMEFWLPSDGLRAEAVDALCRQHVLPGRPRPALPERTLRGMLMGFIDLVYAHGGRYGVLDHKSNALGADDAAYTPAAMDAAMLEHRYDVQAALYLLALHRLLRARLGAAYRPAAQLHGAVYLFLRGVGHATRGGWHLPAPLALIEALDAMAAGPQEPGR